MPPEPFAVKTAHDAFRELRADPATEAIAVASYADADPAAAAARFAASAEFDAAHALVGNVENRTVLDLGAGNGIASVAFAKAGAARVFALEPDPSDEVGRSAIARVAPGWPVEVIAGFGEAIPLSDAAVDVVYARQVLHHAADLEALVAECARVLRLGGTMLVCREHVVNDEAQLRAFLAEHPIHRLTRGEHAYSLDRYLGALRGAGLQVETVLGPWDSVINAYPTVSSEEELADFARETLRRRLGSAGGLLARIPGVEALAWRRLRRPRPGCLYTFVSTRPL